MAFLVHSVDSSDIVCSGELTDDSLKRELQIFIIAIIRRLKHKYIYGPLRIRSLKNQISPSLAASWFGDFVLCAEG
jgi:hypothetical protein